mmetsp:Transcript_10682/g.15423  ORF Transcript_10682/g.15423 Transcript_10682/m.15423 type:complete len:549 (+) Transcript_10682:43-1689(+)
MDSLAKPPPEPPIFIVSSRRTATEGKENVKSEFADRFHKAKTSTIFLCLVASFSLGCLSRAIFELTKIRTHTGPPASVSPTQNREEPIDGNDSFGVDDRPLPQTSSLNVGGYALEYAETIVHPAMLAHPNPSSVLIIGGTKHDVDVQAILIEVFRHNSVERIAVVSSLQKWPQHFVKCTTDGSLTCQSVYDERVEYYDSLEILHQLLQKQQPLKNQKEIHSPFDVTILLHPFDLFSDIDTNEVITEDTYFLEISSLAPATIQALSKDVFMSNNGILVAHLGPSPHLARKSKMQLQDGCCDVNCDENLQLKLIKYMTDHTTFKDLHILEDSNGPGVQGIRTPQSFLVMCKDRNCRQRWYADESYMNYQIRKRLSSFPSYVDGATLQRYNRPPKSWESLFCSFPNKKRECGYMSGFDPAVPNVKRESFEVKPSSIGKHVGRGMFTKVDIVEGSYIMQEVTVQQVRFSVQSYAAIFNVKNLLLDHYNITDDEDENDIDFDYKGWYGINGGKMFEIDSLVTYMDGYGYDIDIYVSFGVQFSYYVFASAKNPF